MNAATIHHTLIPHRPVRDWRTLRGQYLRAGLCAQGASSLINQKCCNLSLKGYIVGLLDDEGEQGRLWTRHTSLPRRKPHKDPIIISSHGTRRPCSISNLLNKMYRLGATSLTSCSRYYTNVLALGSMSNTWALDAMPRI